MSTPKVYAAIAAVAKELASTGISKADENTFDRYKFRGIDAVYNHLAPLLPKHGLVVLPRYRDREVVERVGNKGTALFYVTVTGEFDFVSVEDGSKHTVVTSGEAMDRGDKATNKAMSAAYKYACFQAFCIPTEGDNDADATTHEVITQQQQRLETMQAAFEKNRASIEAFQAAVAADNVHAAVEAWYEIPREDAVAIYAIAPSKGGCLSTRERAYIKSNDFYHARLAFHKEKAA